MTPKNKLSYHDFIKSKVRLATTDGFEVEDSEINPILKPHQRDCVEWAVRGGKRALFESFGLGKSVQQLEILRIILAKLEEGSRKDAETQRRALIVAPLGVRQEFKRDARMLGTELTFVRRTSEVDAPGIYITNYESVRDGKLDPLLFDAVSLDEASVLRGFGGTKTFREFMAIFAGDRKTMNARTFTKGVKYRFVATATPSPNEYIELLAYAGFLDIMEISQAKTRFFKRDSTKADHLTIHPHKEKEFWLWVSSWAMFLQKPSDLGFDDTGYDLPEMTVHFHEVAVDHLSASPDKHGRGRLFREASAGLSEAAKEKRDTLDIRIEKMKEILAAAPQDHFLIWHDLEAERHAIDDALPSVQFKHWQQYKDGHPDALKLYERHYSAYQYADGRKRKLFAGPGFKIVLMTAKRDALFVWRKFIDDSGQKGINCAVFRNEGDLLSSDLIKEAQAIAWTRWPKERLYTYVNGDKIESSNPGYCFLQAGWSKCGKTKGGLIILEMLHTAEVPAVETRLVTKAVFGSQNLDERERAIIDFSDGKFQYLSAKPVIAGSGCNFQRHCHKAIFLGIGYKFNDFIQAIHRIHRFLQDKPVEIHIIYAESEKLVLQALLDKWERDKEQRSVMTEIIQEYGLSHEAMANQLTRGFGVERKEITGKRYTLVNNDAVEETAAMAENSVGLIVTSVPFSTQYEYSPNFNDFGHTDNNEHFFEQMDYLTPNLLRVLQPGRIAAIHVKDRIVPGGLTGLGFQTTYPFHARCIEHYTRHGFAYMGMKTIVTDVVRENNQTYRLGWSEQCKDGTKMGVGMPEYLLIFRKPPTDASNGYGDVPVVKTKQDYSRSRWQIDAHAFARSSGERLLTGDELKGVPHSTIYKMFRKYSLEEVYDFDHHVAIGESLDDDGRLPVTFMLLPPQSWSTEVWSDVTRMRTLNSNQYSTGRQMHLCPLQFDIIDRAVEQWSNKDDLVLDPFGGIGSVAYRSVLKGRRAYSIELSTDYFFDSVVYCEMAEQKAATPTLFDLAEIEIEEIVEEFEATAA